MTRMTRSRRMLVDQESCSHQELNDQELENRTNHLCPHRSRCLSDAWIENRSHLDCHGCPHIYDQDDRKILFSDVEGCLKILWVLYGHENRFDRQEAERLLFDRRDWQEDPVIPNNYLSV